MRNLRMNLNMTLSLKKMTPSMKKTLIETGFGCGFYFFEPFCQDLMFLGTLKGSFSFVKGFLMAFLDF